MGTRSLSGDWLLDGSDVAEQLAEKQRLHATHHDEVFATVHGLDVVDTASAELLAAVVVLRPRSLPDDDSAAQHPLDSAGRLVAEDLCLLVREPDGWILGGASLCFPSHWRLADKLGRSVGLIHDPVPGYATELTTRVDRFLDRLPLGPGVWRRNWTIHDSPTLFAPDVPPPPEPSIEPADAGHRLWLRSERQTLRRLPDSGAIVFGIRSQQVRLDTIAADPVLCQRLADTAAAWPSEFVRYRGGPPIVEPLIAWLRAAAATRPEPGSDASV
ncbi:MAG TPA: DUF3445 domain-containing protein [Acidimicrobiales bacterium]|jgi:hypothetical protein